MSNIRSFPKGGLHPPGRKHISASSAIRNALLPSLCKVPLTQHIGAPCECLVAPGDEVKEGMLLGKSKGFISANIHSPMPGVVKSLDELYLPNGSRCQAVTIESVGEFDRLGKRQEPVDWSGLSSKDLLEKIALLGIVGLGGAAFPTHVKFSIPRDKKVYTFVVNGVECEPYLTADYRIMLEKTKEIFEGIRIIAKILEPERICIGIEINKPDAIEIMTAAAANSGLPVEVVPLQIKYPQGDEKQLLKAIINREVPSGGLPIDIGAVVSNIGTVFAIYEAVVFEKPLIERIVTVTGGGIKNPSNLKVRIGTPIQNLLDECGGFTEEPAKIVVGGPMMGFTIYNLDTPVVKGTSGVLVLTRKEVKTAARTSCIHCGRCVKVCPMGLNPTRLAKQIDHLEYGEAEGEGLMDCKECGCCAYACPAQIPLVQSMKLGKLMLRKMKVKS
ncbi:MAG: electron transport complex subunit RsxC [Spirochaetales bacterium]|nr:MAG: electron transport complex subunit RsxC [Spirochaetales bacterium]